MSYRVTYEIDVEADDPTLAAKEADFCMQEKNRAWKPILKVENRISGQRYVVDLGAETCKECKFKRH